MPSVEKYKIIKFWLTVKSKDEDNTQNEMGSFYSIRDVRIELEAHRLRPTSAGSFEEILVTEKKDPAYIFAKTFTKYYDMIARNFPVFTRLK